MCGTDVTPEMFQHNQEDGQCKQSHEQQKRKSKADEKKKK